MHVAALRLEDTAVSLLDGSVSCGRSDDALGDGSDAPQAASAATRKNVATRKVLAIIRKLLFGNDDEFDRMNPRDSPFAHMPNTILNHRFANSE